VPNLQGERWTKCRRRKPYALRFAVLFLLLLAMGIAGAGYILYQFSQRRDQGRTILAQAQVLLRQQEYQEGLRTVAQGLNILQGVPWSGDLRHQLEEVRGQLAQQAQVGQQRQAAEQLHQVADQIRLLYGFGWQSPQAMASLEKECRTLWEQRALIRERLGPGLGLEAEKRIDTDFLDLAILWADLRVQLAAQTKDRSQLEAALRAGLQVLDQAEALFGPSTVLCRQRQVYAQELGLKDLARTAETQARALPPHNAWEHYTLGEFYLRSNDFAVADQEFRQALRLEPQDLWAEFFHGICAYRLGEYEEAAATFRICCALAPRLADYSFDLAQAQVKIPGQAEEALANYSKALELNPNLVPALLNRGILFSQLHQDDQAIADMLLALDKGADPEAVAHNLHLLYQDPLGGMAEKWLLSWLIPEVAYTGRPRASDH
jgi:eukaryotic-like serine/threonine-protein kinase